jgi:hypothetical protein
MSGWLLADRWLVAVIFVSAGIAKRIAPRDFVAALERYGLTQVRIRSMVAKLLPPLEIAIGLLLAAGVVPIALGFAATAALCFFASAIAWNLLRGRKFDCGCGLGRDTVISWWLVARNVSLAALASAIALGPATALALVPASQHRSDARPSSLVAVPLTVLLGVVSARLWQRAGSTIRLGFERLGQWTTQPNVEGSR